MRFFLRGVIIAIFSFSFCFTLQAELKKKWTFMVYLDGDSELEEQAINDFIEMSTIGTTDDVNIVALFDRSSANDDSYGNWTGTRQGVINQDDVPDGSWGESVGSKNMGNPQTLVNFVDWAASNYTADNYALILWDHVLWLDDDGNPLSAYTSILRDDTSSDVLTTKEVQGALIDINKLQSIQGGFGADHIAFCGIDSDVNGMVEVAYEWRSEITMMDVLTASTGFDPKQDGWQYAPILTSLTANPAMTATDLSKIVIKNVNSKPTTAVKLNQMTSLSAAISNMAKAMNDNWDDTSSEGKGIIREKASIVKSASLNTIIASTVYDDPEFTDGVQGMTINFPSKGCQADYKASNIDFAATEWSTFLNKFSAAMENSWIAEVRNNSQWHITWNGSSETMPYYFLYKLVDDIIGPYDFTVAPASISIDEAGGTGDVTCVLDAQPDSDVTIKASIINNKPVASEPNASIQGGVDSNGDGVANTIDLVFTSKNWSTPQTVTVVGEQDEYAGDDSCQVQFSIKPGSDPNYGHVGNKLVDVTVVSDEKAEIKVTPHVDLPGIALQIPENGGTGTFDFELSGKPRKPVFVKPTSLNTEEANISPASAIQFDENTYNTAVTLTVTGVDDPYVGNDTVDISFSVVGNSDSQWLDAPTVTERVECIDDENPPMTPTFTMSPSTLTVNEDPSKGNTETFTVVLDGKPHVDVKINLTSSDTDALTIDKKSLTFSASNWKTAQTVTVTARDDDLVGNQAISVTGSVDPSSDTHFLTAPDQIVTVNITDNDTPGFTVKPTELKLKENYDSKTFTVVLTKGPASGNVRLDITSDDTNEATATPAFLVFDKTNWNVPQEVRVTSVPDFLLDPNQFTYITVSRNDANTSPQWGSEGPPRDPADQKVKVTLINDDVPGFKLSKTETIVDEGTTGSYTVVLTAQPVAGKTVTINAMSDNIAEVTVTTAPATLTFTNSNWNTPQAISFFGVVDEYATDDRANIVNTVDTSAGTPDTDFNSLAPQSLAVIVDNDDTINSAELTVSTTALTINEIAPGNSDNFTVMLDAKPHSNVVVKVENKDTIEASIDKTELTFTPSNWNVAQLVTVTSVNNNYLGDGTANIELSVKKTASDPTFKDAAKKTVTVTITENDSADYGGVSNSEDGIVVLQNKGKGTFTVALTGRPRSKVVLDLVSDDPAVASVSPATMTFTTDSWANPQKVKVTGDPNNLTIANAETTIHVTANADSDAAWLDWTHNHVPPTDTAATRVTVTSDITGGFALTPNKMTIYEQDKSSAADKQFEVVLNQKPTDTVVLNVASDTPASATAAPAQLTFTTANWYTPQKVIITSSDTDIKVDVDLDIVVSVDQTLTLDSNFDALPAKEVDVTVMNINPVAFDDVAEAINNKPGMIVANDPITIRVLNNDTDPRGNDLTLKLVSVTSGGGTAVINDDQTTVNFTPVTDGTATLSYVATNSTGVNEDSSPATVTITTYNGQAVSVGSVVQLYSTDVPVAAFTRKPALYVLYNDPILSKVKKYTLKGLSKPKPTSTLDVVDNEWKRKIRLYDQRSFSKAYRSGTSFDNYKGQVTSLLTDVYVKTTESKTKMDNLVSWKILVKPPFISAVQRFTTPHDDLTAPTATWAGKLHCGSVVHIIGRYFGTKRPKVWLEYTNAKGAVRMARCKVLKYTPYTDSKGRDARTYMDIDPTSATYADSELKVMLPAKWPKGWDFSLNYTLIVDNGIGKASVGPFTTVASSDSNDAPVAVDDTFNGANSITADTKKNELDILDNDQFPNADYVDVKIISPPDAGGKAKWDKSTGKLIYTPASGFTGIETLTYQVIEKYTEQKSASDATVQITVE